MEKIKYDANLMRTMSVFEKITQTALKDCFIDKNNMMLFIVDQLFLSRAIGKKGQNVKQLEKLLNRKIKIVGFNPQLLQFVKNLVYPIQVKGINEESGIITIIGTDTHSRALLIGKNSQNIKNYLSIIQRYFINIKNIKVI